MADELRPREGLELDRLAELVREREEVRVVDLRGIIYFSFLAINNFTTITYK